MYWIFSTMVIMALCALVSLLFYRWKRAERVAIAFEKAGQRKDEQLQVLEEKLEELKKHDKWMTDLVCEAHEKVDTIEKHNEWLSDSLAEREKRVKELEARYEQETAEDKMLRREWGNLLRFDGTGAGQVDLNED